MAGLGARRYEHDGVHHGDITLRPGNDDYQYLQHTDGLPSPNPHAHCIANFT